MIGIEEGTIVQLPISDALNAGFGTMMPERVVQEILKIGFAAVNKDQSIIDDIFHKLDRASRNDMKKYYAGHLIPVRMNFPRDDFTFPLVAVVSTADDENPSLDSLGDFMGEGFDASGTENVQVLGHMCDTTLSAYCLAGKDSNAALWMYWLVKAFLVMYYLTLEAHGLKNVILRGRDVTFREDLLPEFTYARVLAMSCQDQFSVRVTQHVARVLESVTVQTGGFTAPGVPGRLNLGESEE